MNGNLQLTPVERTLPAPRTNARQTWHKRRGVRLALHISGHVGLGEAWPLPGYSPDDLQQVTEALGGIEMPRAIPTEPRAVEVLCSGLDHVPSARFALETALLHLLAQRRRVPLYHLWNPAPEPVPMSLWVPLPEHESEVAAMVQGLPTHARRSLKVKVSGHLPWSAQTRVLAQLRAELGDGVDLRIDANRSLGDCPDAVVARLRDLHAVAPSYVEEPCALPVLRRLSPEMLQTVPPIASDETLRTHPDDCLNAQSPYRAVVLKPTVLGGCGPCLELAQRAAHRGMTCSLSHTMEGPVAWVACAALALALPAQTFAGIYPDPALCGDPAVRTCVKNSHLVPWAHVPTPGHPTAGSAP